MLKILYPINLIKRFSTVNTSIGYDQFSGSTRECNHLVTPSPWPLCTSQSAFGLVLAMASFFHGYENSVTCFFFALTLTLGCMDFWWRDVVRESTFEGNHTAKVQLGLRLGMLLFIITLKLLNACPFVGGPLESFPLFNRNYNFYSEIYNSQLNNFIVSFSKENYDPIVFKLELKEISLALSSNLDNLTLIDIFKSLNGKEYIA